MDYDEVSQSVQDMQYRWIRSGKNFHFIDQHDGTVIRATGLIMAYDTDEGMFGVNENGRVVCLNPDGLVSTIRLHQKVMEYGGHLALCNHDYHIEHIIDVYGNILNI